jgi:uncharacterized coiled-coil DUF342 family protein
MKLAAEQGERRVAEGLGWDELVAQKRKLSNDLKTITERLVDIDKNKLHALAINIREKRAESDTANDLMRQIRNEIEKNNAELLSVSEKLSQSKNFLSIMEARLPTENEESLHKAIGDIQQLLDASKYTTDREKNDLMSRSKEASMKLEAIKATRIIRDQYAQLTQESTKISSKIAQLDLERDAIRTKLAELNASLDRLYDTKRSISAERESSLLEYDRTAREFDVVNARLDSMAEMRRKQREEYGHGLPSDALYKVKETARKKLEAGGKLTFEELKLLYGEKD